MTFDSRKVILEFPEDQHHENNAYVV